MDNKPISIVIHDAKSNIAKAINSTSLPPSILSLIVNEILQELHDADIRVYKEDLKSYEKALAEPPQEEMEDGEH